MPVLYIIYAILDVKYLLSIDYLPCSSVIDTEMESPSFMRIVMIISINLTTFSFVHAR